MKKVFIVHGFNTGPNSSWIPWLMSELKKEDIYATSLTMPSPDEPSCVDWMDEINRHVSRSLNDEIYLVGHSLGVAAILNYAQNYSDNGQIIKGAVLVSGRVQKSDNPKTQSFYGEFDFEKIKMKINKFSVIHGDNDEMVSVSNAYEISEKLGIEPVIIENGAHLNGSAGWRELPQAMKALKELF